MANLKMPSQRLFDWQLKSINSTKFGIVQRENGQFCVVLNHSLIRGVSAQMIHWWFLNFANLQVKLIDIDGYSKQIVPAYLLWHPEDHHSVTLSGELGSGNTAQAGAFIAIKEAMQYLKYQWKYTVNDTLKIFYCEHDGWAMGKELPFFGKLMSIRLHYKDVFDGGEHIGAHYHYEIVIGVDGSNPLSRLINNRIKRHFSPEFFEAWQTHNAIEVGTFENFLPALYEQRKQLNHLAYSKSMNSAALFEPSVAAFDTPLFEQRMAGYKKAKNVHDYQAIYKPSFLN
jgi:hypothetical protein